MIASGYTVDLYCDIKPVPEHGYHPTSYRELGKDQFSDERPADVWRTVKKAGWLVNKRTGATVCPDCAKAGHTLREADKRLAAG